MRGLLFRLSGLFVICISLAAGWFLLDWQQALNQPLNTGDKSVLYTIEPGMSLKQVTRELTHRGILDRPHYLVWYARMQGKASRIQAGEYVIRPGTTPLQLVDLFVSGEVMQRSLTLVEGWTFKQVMAAVRSHDHLTHTLDGADTSSIMERLGLPGVHPEGRFYPDTYYFPSGTSDLVFLKRAYETMEHRLREEWTKRAENLPYQDPYDALILASIVEKEAGRPDERAQIAGVFVRRLRMRMRLESDPTVIYGLGESFDGNIGKPDLKRDTPYNTYIHRGLPPTAIAIPGGDAIRAALNPELDDALFFVAKGDGSHYFSTTLEEHRRAVARYQLRGRKAKRPSHAHE